ncbi:MAG: VacJ family lipoprotein, partial [Bdellovibrionales bacterium]|nr:VacJ family lipoprotein [Bdellovibrionales bacterium]
MCHRHFFHGLLLTVALLTVSVPALAEDRIPQESVSEEDVYDPFEPVNRGIFWFNDQVDIYVLEPLARGYRYITPEFFRDGVGNFFRNLSYPQYLVSDLVQLKVSQAGEHTARFLINTTIGVGGAWDAADDIFDLEHHEE